MYSIIGDFVRVGSTTRDPYHSMVVQETGSYGSTGGRIVVSMNRCERRLRVHIWQRVKSKYDDTPDTLNPIGSYDHRIVEETFKREAKREGSIV